MSTYQEIKEKAKQYTNPKIFFAFSNKQLEEGIARCIDKEKGEKCCEAGGGLFGTRQGLQEFDAHFESVNKEIAEKCNPQDVYDYEYWNHECDYVCDDEEAIEIVIMYFGKERAKEVKRKHGYKSIDEIKE